MINVEKIKEAFQKIGARVELWRLPSTPSRWDKDKTPVSRFVADIKKDKKGEYFDLRATDDVQVTVLQMVPAERHLLIMAKDRSNPKAKYLCGHDERHWFTAAVPESAPVHDVRSAMQALKPTELQELERNSVSSMPNYTSVTRNWAL